jgi:Protein of unknown function (DUF3467)
VPTNGWSSGYDGIAHCGSTVAYGSLVRVPTVMSDQKPRSARSKPIKPLEARYANYFEVGHNASEFIFDFGQYHPENDTARMHCRIVTGPLYAKLLGDLLCQALERFEEEHGVIASAQDDIDPVELVKQSIAGFDHGVTVTPRTRR